VLLWTCFPLPGVYAHLDRPESPSLPHAPAQLPLPVLAPTSPSIADDDDVDDGATKMMMMGKGKGKGEGDGCISAATYDELERFARYASAAYQLLCPRPLGNTLVRTVSASSSSSSSSFQVQVGWAREPSLFRSFFFLSEGFSSFLKTVLSLSLCCAVTV
jgi:hypothetical protein